MINYDDPDRDQPRLLVAPPIEDTVHLYSINYADMHL